MSKEKWAKILAERGLYVEPHHINSVTCRTDGLYVVYKAYGQTRLAVLKNLEK